jgi:hypothetical protein
MNDPKLAKHFRKLFAEYLGNDFEIIPDPEPLAYWTIIKRFKFKEDGMVDNHINRIWPTASLVRIRPPTVYLRKDQWSVPMSMEGQWEMIEHFRGLFDYLLSLRAEDPPNTRRRIGVTEAHVEEVNGIKYTVVNYRYTDAFNPDE